MMKHFIWKSLFFLAWFVPSVGFAATSTTPLPPQSVVQAVVWVHCGDRQGSGTVINGDQGYVLTSGHVAADVTTGTPMLASSCEVGFLEDPTADPRYYYRASITRFVFNRELGQDFAILQIGEQLSPRGIPRPFPFLKTNEFPAVGDAVQVLGFSDRSTRLVYRTGTIEDFLYGYIKTTAQINPGDSGGPGLDVNNNIIGMATRIVTVVDRDTQKEVISYELVDIRAVMTWLDTFGTNEEDKFFTHSDPVRYHQTAVFINQSDLGCTNLARTQVSPTVYCTMPNDKRLAFPNDDTFLSWFPNFDNVLRVTPTDIAPFTLTGNVTYKPGTLVKSATAPMVYLVVDSFGTLRWIPTEAKAIQLWGPSWASLVHDIPDEFWTNYTMGQPLDG